MRSSLPWRDAADVFGLIAVLLLFCIPLFIRLDGWDLRSDEAIYAYAVDRILQTGDWLTPRSIQTEFPFLEKPPLKFWMTAGLMKVGLLPQNEIGMRLLDAIMGAAGFIYIYLLGARLAGPVCGVVACLSVFTIDAVVFEHGLRSNNMESALFLAYSGAMLHFARWVDRERPGRAHPAVICAYFVLAFMTKFVAALFLPAILVVTAAVTPAVRQKLAASWREWTVPAMVAVAAILPWFIYESIAYGAKFWEAIFGLHVYQRFTSSVDPSHLQPWHFYISETWLALTYAGSRFITGAALAMLAVKAWQGRPWLMRLLLIWLVLPYAAISAGTSKLFHYAYPFMPPIGLAVGWLTARILDAASGPSGERVAVWVHDHVLTGARGRIVKAVLRVAAVALFVLGLATAFIGPVMWDVGGRRVFQNSSIVRPLLIGALLVVLSGRAQTSVRALAALALAIALPLAGYPARAAIATTVDQRWRAIRDCAATVAREQGAPPGVLNLVPSIDNHTTYYYLHPLGPWTERYGDDKEEELRRRLFTAGAETPILMTTDMMTGFARDEIDERWPAGDPSAVAIGRYVIVLPGRYEACVEKARAGGAKPVE